MAPVRVQMVAKLKRCRVAHRAAFINAGEAQCHPTLLHLHKSTSRAKLYYVYNLLIYMLLNVYNRF